MAYELRDSVRKEDKITVITKDPKYHFVPSNPWVAVGWRDREDITVDLAPTMKKSQSIVINLSGRGDKDVQEASRLLAMEGAPPR